MNRHTCSLYGLCYIPATQIPPSGRPAFGGFYPHEECCSSYSNPTQRIALATCVRADILKRRKQTNKKRQLQHHRSAGRLSSGPILTGVSLFWWRRRSQGDRGDGGVSVSRLALLSTTLAPQGVGWALRDNSREVRQGEKHQAGRVDHPDSRWNQAHLQIKTKKKNIMWQSLIIALLPIVLRSNN